MLVPHSIIGLLVKGKRNLIISLAALIPLKKGHHKLMPEVRSGQETGLEEKAKLKPVLNHLLLHQGPWTAQTTLETRWRTGKESQRVIYEEDRQPLLLVCVLAGDRQTGLEANLAVCVD